MKTIAILAAALLLAACGTPPRPAYQSFCTVEKGTQIIPQPNGDVLITGATTCRSDNSPFEGLPVRGKVVFEDGTRIVSEPDMTMVGLHGDKNYAAPMK